MTIFRSLNGSINVKVVSCHIHTLKYIMNSLKHEQPSSRPSRSHPDDRKTYHHKDGAKGSELWTDGLICAYEFISGKKKKSRDGLHSKNQIATGKIVQDITRIRQSDPNNLSKINVSRDSKLEKTTIVSTDKEDAQPSLLNIEETDGNKGMVMPRESQSERTNRNVNKLQECYWVPIGWSRLLELVQIVQVDAEWTSQPQEYSDEYDTLTVADVAAPYWQRPAGPTWWCHVMAGHPSIDSWLKNSRWLHPAISTALRDESQLISERMKHLLYEVPVRVGGGLLFELLGQTVGDPRVEEDDVPIVLRSWQAQNFLVTALHVKGTVPYLNVLGIIEVQDLLVAGGAPVPKTAHELIANLTCRLARWDDRLFRKYIFGQADEVELKFVNRRSYEDLTVLGIILNQEVRRLSAQVIRVKWSLHAREEIVFELSEHLTGRATQEILDKVRKSTREMIVEQEAVRDRLFTVQDVMQNTMRALLQDKSIRITHNMTVIGGGGLVLTILTGLFGVNIDGIPGGQNTPYAFALFSGILLFLGMALVGFGMLYFGLKKPITEEQVKVRRMELEDLVDTFQHDAETHAKFQNPSNRHQLQLQGDERILDNCNYIVIR